MSGWQRTKPSPLVSHFSGKTWTYQYLLTTNLSLNQPFPTYTPIYVHMYIHTYLPTYIPTYLPIYLPSFQPHDASHSIGPTFGLFSLAFDGFSKSRYFLLYKHLCSLATALRMLSLTSGLPTAQLLGIPFSPNMDSSQWLKFHSLQFPPQVGNDRSSFTSYFTYHTFLKGSVHPSKYFIIYS